MKSEMEWEFDEGYGWQADSLIHDQMNSFRWVIQVCQDGKFDVNASDGELCNGISAFDTLAAAQAYLEYLKQFPHLFYSDSELKIAALAHYVQVIEGLKCPDEFEEFKADSDAVDWFVENGYLVLPELTKEQLTEIEGRVDSLMELFSESLNEPTQSF